MEIYSMIFKQSIIILCYILFFNQIFHFIINVHTSNTNIDTDIKKINLPLKHIEKLQDSYLIYTLFIYSPLVIVIYIQCHLLKYLIILITTFSFQYHRSH